MRAYDHIRLAIDAAKGAFHDEALDTPGIEHQALGKAISEYYGPDRHGLTEAFIAALEDANCHTQAAQARGWQPKK